MSAFTDYSRLITRPINLSILLNFILCYERENPKNLVRVFFVLLRSTHNFNLLNKPLSMKKTKTIYILMHLNALKN
jgi:hypothetical protein